MPSRRRLLRRARLLRLRNYERRKKGPGVAPAGHDCVVVHLLADDDDLITKYGVDRSTCTSADAWWRFANDVVLLQVASRSVSEGEEGLYGRREVDDGSVVLSAIVAEPLVSSAVMARVMDRFVEAFRAGDLPPLCALPKHARRFAASRIQSQRLVSE